MIIHKTLIEKIPPSKNTTMGPLNQERANLQSTKDDHFPTSKSPNKILVTTPPSDVHMILNLTAGESNITSGSISTPEMVVKVNNEIKFILWQSTLP